MTPLPPRCHPGRSATLRLAALLALAQTPAAQTFERVWIDELLDGDHHRAEAAFIGIGGDPSHDDESRALALGRAAEIARATGRDADHRQRLTELAALVGRASRHSLAVPMDSLPRSSLREALAETDPTRTERALSASRDRFLRAIDGNTRVRVYVEPIRRLTLTARDLEYARLRSAIRNAEASGDQESANRARRDLQRRLFGESIRRRVRSASARLVQSLADGRLDDADDLLERARAIPRAGLASRREPRADPDPQALRVEARRLAQQLGTLDPQADKVLLRALRQLHERIREKLATADWGGAEQLLSRLPRSF